MKRSIPFLVLAWLAALPTGVAADESFSLAGTWTAVTAGANGEDLESKVTFEKDGEDWSAKVESSLWKEARSAREVTFDGETLRYAVDVDYEGQKIVYAVKAKAEGKALKGTWNASGADGAQLIEGAWSAQRFESASSPLIGDWNVTATGTDDGPKLKFKASFAQDEDDESISGKLVSLIGKIDMKSVEADGDEVGFSLAFPYDDKVYAVDVKAKVSGDEMDGRWVAKDDDGKEQATGNWSALRDGVLFLEGAWAVTATRTDGNEMESTFRFQQDDDEWSGVAIFGDRPEIKLDKVTLEGKDLVVDLEVPRDGAAVEVRIKAAFGEGQWLGKWTAFDETGSEAASGKWLAKPSSES